MREILMKNSLKMRLIITFLFLVPTAEKCCSGLNKKMKYQITVFWYRHSLWAWSVPKDQGPIFLCIDRENVITKKFII